VRRCLTQAGFVEQNLAMVEPEPSYLMFSIPSFLLGLSYLVNQADFLSSFRACILACFPQAVVGKLLLCGVADIEAREFSGNCAGAVR
jgi:hypothetical protein